MTVRTSNLNNSGVSTIEVDIDETSDYLLNASYTGDEEVNITIQAEPILPQPEVEENTSDLANYPQHNNKAYFLTKVENVNEDYAVYQDTHGNSVTLWSTANKVILLDVGDFYNEEYQVTISSSDRINSFGGFGSFDEFGIRWDGVLDVDYSVSPTQYKGCILLPESDDFSEVENSIGELWTMGYYDASDWDYSEFMLYD